jgi:UDPglucose--hexose-1-phosphate uridylyltransferase
LHGAVLVSHLRLNPLTGRWVAIAAGRAARPSDLVSPAEPCVVDPSEPCPFCPGHEEATAPALETYDRGGQWTVRVVPNRYPAFDGAEALHVSHLGPVFTEASASGIHEVLVFTPDHDVTWADLDDKQVAVTMAAIRDRMEEHSRRPVVRYTQAIVNHGHDAGASLEHPHGQLLGIPFVPGEIAEEEAGFQRFGGPCLLCTTLEAELDAGHRVVLADERAVVLSPYWSGTPYEMLVVPRDHQAHASHAEPRDVTAVGRALRSSLAKLRGCLGQVSYNLVFHTAAHRSDGPFHWHVHVWPRVTSIAGFEQGTGVMINILAPELATQHLSIIG